MSQYHVREFEPADTPACVAMMNGNTPEFFTETELAEFPAFLASRDSPYLVVQDQTGRLVACGGYYVNPEERWGGLMWGMVANGEQRRGIGSLLLGVRLKLLREEGVGEVRLDTSQLSRAFYERHGFVVVSIQPDGYRPGLDRWDMKRRIDPGASGTTA